MLFGFRGNGSFPQGGMNTEGLFFDGTYIDKIPLDPQMRDGRKAAKTRIFKHMLKRCATVEEALEYLDQFFIPFIRSAQVVVADKTGDYAVVHANGVVQRRSAEERFAVITNFHLSQAETGDYSCSRYDHARERLANADKIDERLFREILDATHQNGEQVKTVYSNIYNLTDGVVHNYYLFDYAHPIVIRMADIASPDQVSQAPVLFQDLQGIREEQH
ncbi:MAG: hypothetical protein R3330_09430 [Saprospiraceae bacterium]|nr:hypothetical protein [Saprospiraceae bacterium]